VTKLVSSTRSTTVAFAHLSLMTDCRSSVNQCEIDCVIAISPRSPIVQFGVEFFTRLRAGRPRPPPNLTSIFV